jgi:sulfide:quinone oxidoreductase
MHGKELPEQFDGHSLCFIESGNHKAALIDFNYETEPLPGTYPIPGIGPMMLLKETVLNHWGKLGFRYMYYYLMLNGIDVPLPNKMSMAGKQP